MKGAFELGKRIRAYVKKPHWFDAHLARKCIKDCERLENILACIEIDGCESPVRAQLVRKNHMAVFCNYCLDEISCS